MAKLTISTSTTSQSISNNYSKVRVQLVLDTTMNPYSFNNDSCNGWVKIDGTKYNFSSKWKQKAKTTIYDSTKTIYHNSDGNKTLSINASFNGETSEVGTVTASTSVKLKQIYRNSVLNNLTASKGSWEFDVGTSFGVKITKYNSSYTDTLTLKIKSDGTTLKTISNISTGDTITFTDDEIDLMYQKTPNSKICELSYTLTTKNGSTTIGSSSGTIKGYINVPPTIQSISPTPDNKTKELTGVNVAPYKYIKNYSNVNVIATALGNKYATIDHFTVGSSIYQATNGSATFEISKISSKDLIVYAVDSRTNETSQTTTLDLLEYISITKGTQSSSRKNNIEEETTISFNGKFWNNNFGSVQNTLTASYKYKISGSSTWTTGTSTITPTFDENGNFQFSGSIKGDKATGFDIANSYDIEVVVKDKLTEISYTYLINSGKPAIAVYKSNVAIGDKYDEELGGNQLWGNIYLNGKEIHKNKLLWTSDGWQMSGGVYATLNEKVSEQETGIVLHWQAYVSGEVKNYDHIYKFIPKQHVINNDGAGVFTNMATTNWGTVCSKYLYVSDTKLTGHADNNKHGTGTSGVKYDNKHWVLTEVIGV